MVRRISIVILSEGPMYYVTGYIGPSRQRTLLKMTG